LINGSWSTMEYRLCKSLHLTTIVSHTLA
jgi:hypothetical protein